MKKKQKATKPKAQCMSSVNFKMYMLVCSFKIPSRIFYIATDQNIISSIWQLASGLYPKLYIQLSAR